MNSTTPRPCPGPWTHDSDNHAVLDKWGNPIATLIEAPHFDNGDLITAAPALLDMLDRLLLCCELNQDDMEDETRILLNEAWKLHDELTPAPCKHPPERVYAWEARDGTTCAACCECGAVLKGGAE